MYLCTVCTVCTVCMPYLCRTLTFISQRPEATKLFSPTKKTKWGEGVGKRERERGRDIKLNDFAICSYIAFGYPTLKMSR